MAEENILTKKTVCLDVPTRWNSVYDMLERACEFKTVFERYELCDADFRTEFTQDKIQSPNAMDWSMVQQLAEKEREAQRAAIVQQLKIISEVEDNDNDSELENYMLEKPLPLKDDFDILH
ncbi:hypothetical protein M569_05272 [Genlisea aurea]|uniref:Uncharacterized protein n=1 Tax=Genlisea aurea TaxID=192259 RepID=S8CWZ5_9LAMI|nr:hypothetical protein M569_05272 [Genlisea aurea]